MLLHTVTINNFRNYINTQVNIDGAKTIFLIGENGQGKTNFLEALYYLSYASSFRTNKDTQLINHKQNLFYINACFQDKNKIDQKISISYEKENKKKIIKYNDKKIVDRKDLIHQFPTLIFKHSDIQFITGIPEFQRQLIDQTLVLTHTSYLTLWREYKKIVKQKTQALKQKRFNLISTYNNLLAEQGVKIMEYREELIHFFSQNIQTLFAQIFNTSNLTKVNADVKYGPSWKTKDKNEIYSMLESQIEQEKQFGFCISGPQRDKLLFYISNYPVKEIGSTGQIRLFSILLRALQAQYYYKHTNTTMIYLFDDVFLEIDIEKRMRFLQLLPKAKQMFFTFLPSEPLPKQITGDIKKYKIEKGSVLHF